MLEKDIVAAIMRWLKTVPRCFAWKEHGGMYGTAGIPDVICCLDGRFFAFEVKTPEGVVVTDLGRLLIRNIAMRFDAYASTRQENRFSRTI